MPLYENSLNFPSLTVNVNCGEKKKIARRRINENEITQIF